MAHLCGCPASGWQPYFIHPYSCPLSSVPCLGHLHTRVASHCLSCVCPMSTRPLFTRVASHICFASFPYLCPLLTRVAYYCLSCIFPMSIRPLLTRVASHCLSCICPILRPALLTRVASHCLSCICPPSTLDVSSVLRHSSLVYEKLSCA